MRSYYAVLGIPTPRKLEDITQADIVKAYRSRARVVHPNRNPALNADEQMKTINVARDVLTDPTQRQLYDMTVNLN